MKRCASLFLAVCLTLLMFPTASYATDGCVTVGVSAMTNSPATAEMQATGTATSSPSGNIRHVISQTIGTKSRTVPAATNFSDAFGVTNGYPAYNGTFNADVKNAGGNAEAQEAAVLAENVAIMDYDTIDSEGNLYKGGTKKTATEDGKTVTKLVRHTAGVENYGAAIPDDAPSTTKLLSVRTLNGGNVVTGLYAPPGEIVKITLNSSSSDVAPQDLGLKVLIGNYSGQDSRLIIDNTNKFDLTRMPDTGKTIDLSNKVNYVGSPLGGAILIYSSDKGGTTIQMTIEGAVEMPTYFYGETTDEELTEQLKKPGPYFAFSTPRGVRAVGPASLVRNLSVEQVKSAMDFWDKAIGVSCQFEAGSFDFSDPDMNLMVETFDPYIPIVGALAANMGTYCVCPISSGASFFDCETLVSQGSWATIHELNHSFPWGGAVDDTREISNNAINALTYQLYTNIAASRTEPTNRADPGSNGLDGWNWCTDLFSTVERLRLNVEHAKSESSADFPYARWDLQVYVPLQHAFGADRFLEAVHLYHDKGGAYNKKLSGNALATNSNVWMRSASEASGYDLGYYMRDVQQFPELDNANAAQTDYITTDVRESLGSIGPLYIPSGCLYASGVVYETSTSSATGLPAAVSGNGNVPADTFANGKNTVEMGRAFRIPYGKPKTLYFNPSTQGGRVSVANGESVEMVGYTAPQHGTLEATDDSLQLEYTPDPDNLDDCFYVTLKLTVTDEGSPYRGQSQNVTFKVTLLQDTSQVGFSTTYYEWPKTLAAYNQEDDPIQTAIEGGVLKQIPLSTQVKGIAGFDNSVQEPSGRFAVVEGELMLTNVGPYSLLTRGNPFFSTCVAASPADLPTAADAQSKVKGNVSEYSTTNSDAVISVFVAPQGTSIDPSDPFLSAYDAVACQGDPLYVRAYVAMPYACSCNYRIGYRNGSEKLEFSAEALTSTTTTLETPAISSYTTGKAYSQPDSALQATNLREFKRTDKTLTCTNAWNADRESLPSLNSTLANITDADLGTHFHSATSGSQFTAEFIFELGEADEFNAIRYKGHSKYPTRGKFGDYELYVGSDRTELLNADASSSLLVSKGTAQQACDEDVFNYISWDQPTNGKYVRLVVTSSYPFNGQYYYAFSDFTVGTYREALGLGLAVDELDESGTWTTNESLFLNTRNAVRETTSGSSSHEFTGTGIIAYALKGPDYGTMTVTLDGVSEDMDLNKDSLCASTPVFWASGLDATEKHTITFAPKNPGTDKINIEYLEIKGAPEIDDLIPDRMKTLSVTLDAQQFTYTGSDIKPHVQVFLAGATTIDVTDKCAFSYSNNVNVGTASLKAMLTGTSGVKTAYATFDIKKANYAGNAKASLAENATSWTYGQKAAVPKPRITAAPSGATTTFYYSTSKTGTGTKWPSTMKSTALLPGTYYLWGVSNSPNYNTVTTPRTTYKVKVGSLAAVKVNTAKTYPTSLQFPKQTPAGIGSTTGITFDIYVKEAKTGAKWVKKLSGLTAAKMKKSAYTISKLGAKKTYQYQVRATRKLSGKTVATSTWTSGKIKTGANITPKIKSVKTSNVRIFKKGKKTYTSYKLKVTLAKKLGNGTQGIMTSNGLYAKGAIASLKLV